MEKTYYVEASRHEKNEYRVEDKRFQDESRNYKNPELNAYNEMVEWMKGMLQPAPDGTIPVRRLDAEYSAERSMNVTSLETIRRGPDYRVLEDNEIILDADVPFQELKPVQPYEAKGYDLAEDAYFFATVDTWRTVKPYTAESPEQALQMAKGDQLHNVLVKVQPVRQFLHAPKDEKVTLEDGLTINIVSEEDFQERLREKFPEGLTVRLADESYSNLLKLKDWDITNAEQYDDWQGLANPGNDHMLVAHGSIPAELRLQPKDYKFIYACEDTYYNELLLSLLEDDGITASSLLLAEEYKMEAMRVKVLMAPSLLDRLFIAGKPYDTMMEMAQENNVKDEKDFNHMLDKAYMNEQPDWVKEQAKEQTAGQRHKAFINLTANPTGEYYKAHKSLLEEAAGNIKGCTVGQLQDYLKKPSTIPDELKEEVICAATHIQENIQPYEKAMADAYKKYNYAVTYLEAEFARKLNDFIRNRVKGVTMYPNNQWQWSVRCQINGEQQMGRPITDKEANAVRKGGEHKMLKDMACRYFKDEIVAAMTAGQEQSQKMKR